MGFFERDGSRSYAGQAAYGRESQDGRPWRIVIVKKLEAYQIRLHPTISHIIPLICAGNSQAPPPRHSLSCPSVARTVPDSLPGCHTAPPKPS